MDNHEEMRHRRIMNKRRVDPESIDGLETQAGNLKEAITRGEIIVNNLKDNPGWLALQQNWTEQLEEVEEKLTDFHTLSDKGRDFILKERQDLKHVIETVEHVEKRTVFLKNQLSETLNTLRERKERLGAAQV
jgi:hypothetical protein